MAASVLFKAFCRTYQGVFRVAVNFLNWKEPELVKGAGSVKKLPEVVKSNGHDSVLVVTDKGLMNLHLLDGLFEGLEKSGVKYAVYDGTQPNPTIDNIEEARQLYVDNNCSALVAFGGGSPMDCAKVAAARIAKPKKTVQQMRGTLKILKKLPTLYAVPTTAGTGSETTIAAVVSDPRTHEKYALQDPVLRPKYAVLDPELTVGLPPHITSTTGMDALTHAVEAYIGHSNTKETAAAAEKATKMIFENILKVYENGKDVEARENMLDEKLFGVFPHRCLDTFHPLMRGLDDEYYVPHSRHTKNEMSDIALVKDLQIISYSEQAGVHLISDMACRKFFATGHSEYDRDTLSKEYFRDVNKGLDIKKPYNYFPDDDETKTPVMSWRSAANLIFTNWLNYFVYQQTPYDLSTL